MENFATFINQIPSKYEEAAGFPEVKIAVLDDGIDALHKRFEGSIAGGISFCEWRREGVETDGMKSHCFSSTGHGTEMADRIRQVFPKAKLYIARLDVKSGEKRTPEITAKSAVKVGTELETELPPSNT
jgi:subtilisin family serine protease